MVGFIHQAIADPKIPFLGAAPTLALGLKSLSTCEFCSEQSQSNHEAVRVETLAIERLRSGKHDENEEEEANGTGYEEGRVVMPWAAAHTIRPSPASHIHSVATDDLEGVSIQETQEERKARDGFTTAHMLSKFTSWLS